MVFSRGDAAGDNETLDHIETNNNDVELVTWDGPDDPENPFNWSLRQKWAITGLAILATFITIFNGTIITVAHDATNAAFHVSDAGFPNSYWPVTSWSMGGAFSSLFLLPLMEDFGVRGVFLSTWAVFILFVIPQAVAQNFATMIVTRFFAGGCCSILSNTAATVIGNIWQTDRERNSTVRLYIAAYMAGSSIGPVIGAPIFQFLSWRWIGYMQLIWYGAFFPIYIFWFKECREIAILGKRAKALRQKGRCAYTQHELDREGTSMLQIVVRSASRPMVMFFTEGVLFILALWSAFTVGTLYLFTQSVEQVFAALYGWSPADAGYIQSAIVIGQLFGLGFAMFSGKIYFNSAARNKECPGTPIPEARLYLAVLGGIFGISGGMFTYAWTSYASFPWIAPAIGLSMVGAGSILVVEGLSGYLMDAYSNYAASAVGACVTGENILSAFLPLAAGSMYTNLGFQWASSLLALISLILCLGPILFVIYGKEIRAKSPLMTSGMMEKARENTESV
ncbi:Major facilitator superfamily domain general substrate transporter [Penicillium taxi]|uniref:Major facilitator superfamily domain general substrate transporter n=1 Tax=Penicillium taxi TaxID=168475 RepID=UPI0025452C9B|nr:Major facilitator superfamily domain general substrate transporter [Penicillium taxi]KAJ5908201.1 Major facilitator superfamily domain general substrate transporter [Penicillium taxi]